MVSKASRKHPENRLTQYLDGHYLNLPVMSEAGEIVGMVDVLKLTYATLDQINSMSTGDNEGPAWQKFWMSLGHETESGVSGGESSSKRPHTPQHRSIMSPAPDTPARQDVGDSVMPHESASHHGDDIDEHSAVAAPSSVEDLPFAFKFKAPSGRVHRLQVIASAGIEDFVANVTSKLGGEIDSVGGEPPVTDGRLGKSGFALSYMDNEGDIVSITTNQDLLEAITMARKSEREKVDLFVHDPEKPALPPTLDPQPPASAGLHIPVDPSVRERRRKLVDEADDEDEQDSRRRSRSAKHQPPPQQQQAQQVIQGVPNELLLPGAVAALAFVIVGVFAFSRATGSNR